MNAGLHTTKTYASLPVKCQFLGIQIVRAVIEEGKNGFMVEPYNAAQTAEKLRILLSGKADWQSLREAAHQTVEKKFSIDDYVKKLENLYAEIINGYA